MKEIIEGKRYDTEKAVLLASDRYWDGHIFERHGRNTYLYVTKKGNYFLKHTTLWQGERDHIEAISKEEALSRYEQLTEKEKGSEKYFEEIIEDA